MARKVMRNINAILAVTDYKLVCDICEVIAKKNPRIAYEALQYWQTHNESLLPDYLREF